MEWDVSESPSGPTGHLVSMKLRALTPDGIRIAIAKEYGLSNYREVTPAGKYRLCIECCCLQVDTCNKSLLSDSIFN